MSFEQRTTPEPDHLEPAAPWLPERLTALEAARPLTPRRPPDRYVVVDELDELGCRLAIDLWPAVDADGRLVFDDRGAQLVSVPPRAFHDWVVTARLEAGDEAPRRELRIGDVFAVWSGRTAGEVLGLPPSDRGATTAQDLADPTVEIVDVTRDARAVTNAAAQAAAGDVLTATDVETFAVRERPPDGSGGRFR